ncbi:MAG: N-formylglutamate amidohydrolase [Proteobacteria bacterium]|nr:N-formylglutamate amidohydrolase [Pseudomonadota bacterium]
MRSSDDQAQGLAPPAFDVLAPRQQTVPFVYASPHSGDYYPPAFIAEANLGPLALRRSEDSFVDELFASAPRHGAPLLRAIYPRVYLDPNREPYELDPGMFADSLPDYVNTNSARVSVGLGTVARVVANGANIYRRKLLFAEARQRIERIYVPYHGALKRLLADTEAAFGCAVLVDCHSMPSTGGPMDRDSGRPRGDLVLGDRFGTSCAPVIVDLAERVLLELGYRVTRNDPYAGGFVTQHYGRPGNGVHTLQIEINRSLYMDEKRIQPTPGMAKLSRDLDTLIGALAAVDVGRLIPAKLAAQ